MLSCFQYSSNFSLNRSCQYITLHRLIISMLLLLNYVILVAKFHLYKFPEDIPKENIKNGRV